MSSSEASSEALLQAERMLNLDFKPLCKWGLANLKAEQFKLYSVEVAFVCFGRWPVWNLGGFWDLAHFDIWPPRVIVFTPILSGLCSECSEADVSSTKQSSLWSRSCAWGQEAFPNAGNEHSPHFSQGYRHIYISVFRESMWWCNITSSIRA